MIILVYTGILLLSYGIYNMICYLIMLPTAKSGRNILSIGTERKNSFWGACTIIIAEYYVKEYDLKWRRAEEMDKRLIAKVIYSNSAVYLIGNILYYFLGLFLVFPVMLIDRRLFLLLFIVWTIIRLWDCRVIVYFDIGLQLKQKIRKMMRKLLPGAFFIAQMLLLIYMFT